MEKNEISLHEVKIYLCLKNGGWMTHKDIESASGINPRTVRAHTKRFVGLGILDVAEVFPAHRYRISDKARKRNASYALRLDKAVEVFGLT